MIGVGDFRDGFQSNFILLARGKAGIRK
jgi:hypothetical protein